MKSKKQIKIVDYQFDESLLTNVFSKPNMIRLSFFIECCLHYCHELGIPELIFSYNSNRYQSLYLSRQKNKKYLDKILELKDNSFISNWWKRNTNSILTLRSNMNHDQRNIIEYDQVAYKTKLISQKTMDYYLELMDNHGINYLRYTYDKFSISKYKLNGMTILNGTSLNGYQLVYEDSLANFINELDNDEMYLNYFISKGHTDASLTVYSFINDYQVYNKYNYVINSEYIKSACIKYDNMCFYKQIKVNKNTLHKLLTLMNSDQELGLLSFQKLNLKQNGTVQQERSNAEY